MDNGDLCLPFKVGEEAESKSFEEGFRSAWFRCKIKEISRKKGVLGHRLEFFDYPDEKVRWVKLYQSPPYTNQRLGLHDNLELVIRPHYPPLYRDSSLPNGLRESDVVVIVNDTWKVGDLVDWWCDGCFWISRITQILGNDKVQIKLPDPPVGQGCCYEAHCNDLRPSLDWSQEHGWMVPLSEELGNGRYCARLNWLHEEDAQRSYLDAAVRNNVVEEATADRVYEESSFEDEDKDELGAVNDSYTREGRYLMPARSSTTLESSIMNLEEVTCKIRWLKGLLKFGFQWSDLMIPSWKFLDTHDIHLQKVT